MKPFTDRTPYKQAGTEGRGTKRVHISVAEKALGRSLPPGAEVHHVNEIKTDNRGCNLVICPSAAYHRLLHQRTRAYDVCGHAHWLKCSYCGNYDAPENLVLRSQGSRFHRKCKQEYARKRVPVWSENRRQRKAGGI